MARKVLAVRLPEELLEQLDQRRKDAGDLSRTEWTEKAITYLLSLPIRDRSYTMQVVDRL